MKSQRETRVLIVDDHPIVREGLRTLLGDETGLVIVGEAGDGPEALRQIEKASPDVVLMDLALPAMDGIEVTKQALLLRPELKVIILTSSFGVDQTVASAVAAGVTGFLLKDISRDDLVSAIARGAQGLPTLHPEAQGALMRATQTPAHATLTEREMDVLRLLAEGESNRRIATRLFLSEGTVKGYVSIILSKLQVEDRTQAALYAVRNGLG